MKQIIITPLTFSNVLFLKIKKQFSCYFFNLKIIDVSIANYLIIFLFLCLFSACDPGQLTTETAFLCSTCPVEVFDTTGPIICSWENEEGDLVTSRVFNEINHIRFGNSNTSIKDNDKINIFPLYFPYGTCVTTPLFFNPDESHVEEDPLKTQVYQGPVTIVWEKSGRDYLSYAAAKVSIQYYVDDSCNAIPDMVQNLHCFNAGDAASLVCLSSQIKMYNPFQNAKPDIVVEAKCTESFADPYRNSWTFLYYGSMLSVKYLDNYSRIPEILPLEPYTTTQTKTVYKALINPGTYRISVDDVSLIVLGMEYPAVYSPEDGIATAEFTCLSNCQNDFKMLLSPHIPQSGNQLKFYWKVKYSNDDISNWVQTSEFSTSRVDRGYRFNHVLSKAIYEDNNWNWSEEKVCASWYGD